MSILDDYITSLIQHADYIARHSIESSKPIVKWKSYKKMKKPFKDLVKELLEKHTSIENNPIDGRVESVDLYTFRRDLEKL